MTHSRKGVSVISDSIFDAMAIFWTADVNVIPFRSRVRILYTFYSVKYGISRLRNWCSRRERNRHGGTVGTPFRFGCAEAQLNAG